MYENSVSHTGVKGMRWGVRKSSKPVSNVSKPVKPKAKEMSDDELRKHVNRLQLERQYDQLSPSKVNTGKQYVDKIIKTGATIAGVTTTALTLYNNFDKIKNIVSKYVAK